MANAYQWLGAAGGAQAGVQGAQALAELLARQNQQQAAAAELDIRRSGQADERLYREQYLSNQATDREAQREYQMGVLDRQTRANDLAEARAAAEYGDFTKLASLIGGDPSTMRRYEPPPGNLEAGLTRILYGDRGDQGPTQLSGPGVDPGAGIQVEGSADQARMMDAIRFVNSFRPRYTERTVAEQHFTNISEKIKSGTASEEEIKQYNTYVNRQTGAGRSSEFGSTPTGYVSRFEASVRNGYEPTEQEWETYKIMRSAVKEPAGLSTARTTSEPVKAGAAATSAQADKDRAAAAAAQAKVAADREAREKQKDWNNLVRDANAKVAKIMEDFNAFMPGRMKESKREGATNEAVRVLMTVRSQAETDQQRAQLDQLIAEVRRQMLPPLPAGSTPRF